MKSKLLKDICVFTILFGHGMAINSLLSWSVIPDPARSTLQWIHLATMIPTIVYMLMIFDDAETLINKG